MTSRLIPRRRPTTSRPPRTGSWGIPNGWPGTGYTPMTTATGHWPNGWTPSWRSWGS